MVFKLNQHLIFTLKCDFFGEDQFSVRKIVTIYVETESELLSRSIVTIMCVFGPFVVFADFSVSSIVHSILNHVGNSLPPRFGVFWGNENKLAVDSSSVFNNLVTFY